MCQPCDSNCLTCQWKANNCTSCRAPWTLNYGFVCGCPEDTYQSVVSGNIACIKCSTVITGCFKCSGQSVCTACMNNLVLSAPASCACPEGATLLTVGASHYCLSSAVLS